VARLASTVLVVALLAATVAAFALTQGLKQQKSPVFRTSVDKIFSPVCSCTTGTATIAFRLREPDRLDVTILDGDHVVRTLVSGRRFGRDVELRWDGRDDSGEVLPEGEYRPRVRLREDRSTITFPNPMEIDVTPPVLEDVRIAPLVISPDGDGRRDRTVIRYRLNEDAKGMLFVDRQRHTVTKFARPEDTIVWNGRRGGRSLPPGLYELVVSAQDPAGNVLERRPRPDAIVRVRYVALGRTRIPVVAGRRFAVRVSADAARVRWTLGRRSGLARPGTLRLRAPAQKGQFTLVVSANGRSTRAAVFVREAPSERPR
jgi:FlgD Ig-like domain